MESLQLKQQLRDVLNVAGVPLDVGDTEESLTFAVDFCRIAVRALSLVDPNPDERAALVRAIHARTDFPNEAADQLLSLALAPRFRATISDHELRAFAGRFGAEAAEVLRKERAAELDLAGYAARYGASEALLLLDTLFAVAGADGEIAADEVRHLQQAARELGVDEVLVTALLQKHDPHYAQAERRVPIQGARVVIGRAPGCDITLHDPQVATRHAELLSVEEGWRVVDLNSGRPTVVNGAAIRSAPLTPSDQLRIGPYVLRVVEDEVLIDGERSFSALSVRQLSRQIGDLQLLDDVSFTAFTGEVIALVGPSGAGKTTLLNAINGVAPADSGQVLMDGQPFHPMLAHDRSLVGIVPQDDLVSPELSVRESLYYSGRLRFPPDVSRDEVDQAVGRVMRELDIHQIRDSRIGDVVRRGISGGQRKRVNLGQELLTRSTRVLFLDEPTSGLDPRASQDIVRLARQLADHGRIVFLVTHDLTPEIMVQVDHLLVLVPGGRLAYYGPPDQACRWFGVGTTDAIFNRLMDHEPAEWGRLFREGADFRKYVRTREHLLGLEGMAQPSPTPARRPRRRPLSQLRTLTSRYWRVKLRDRTGMAVLALQPPLLALVMAVVFPKPTSPALFMLALSALWFGMSASVRELIADRVIWNRERRVGVGVLPYVGSKVLVLGVLVAGQCALMSSLLYAAFSLGDYEFGFWTLTGVAVLIGEVGMSLGLLVGASWTSSEAAVGTLPLLLIPQITLSSIMVSLRHMTPLAKALSWTAIQRYALDAVIKSGHFYAEADPYIKNKWTSPSNTAVLYKLGLKPTSGADDMGLTLAQLVAVLAGFMVLHLVATVGLVWWRGRDGR